MKPTLVHCSYHKCLTVYYQIVIKKTLNLLNITEKQNLYKHYRSDLNYFYKDYNNYEIVSINNHSIDFSQFSKNYKISRFIRDPRDLIVSGYYYHKAGKEKWCHVQNPKATDWKDVNGKIPTKLKNYDGSYSELLNQLSLEEGLLAEIEFRQNHFESMLNWPNNDKNIITFKYEDIIGNEGKVFKEMFNFYGYSFFNYKLAQYFANKHSANKQTKSHKHIRNPQPKQWKAVFSQNVKKYFYDKYYELIKNLNYDI